MREMPFFYLAGAVRSGVYVVKAIVKQWCRCWAVREMGLGAINGIHVWEQGHISICWKTLWVWEFLLADFMSPELFKNLPAAMTVTSLLMTECQRVWDVKTPHTVAWSAPFDAKSPSVFTPKRIPHKSHHLTGDIEIIKGIWLDFLGEAFFLDIDQQRKVCVFYKK